MGISMISCVLLIRSNRFSAVVSNLLNGIALDQKYKEHFLKGNPERYKECHLKPDLLLIYRVYKEEIQLIDIGSHSELFE